MLSRIKSLIFLTVLLVTALSLAYSSIFLLFAPPSRNIYQYPPSSKPPLNPLHCIPPPQNPLIKPALRENIAKTKESPPLKEWDSSKYLKGPPTDKFRDNLLENEVYITAGSNAGFTNQLMSYTNMIYLGMISGRVPIIPPFGPDHHISLDAGVVPFGNIFNMSRARDLMRYPLLEWRDVKKLPSTSSSEIPRPEEREELGCWSTRHGNDPLPLRVKWVMDHLKLDISYTRAPTEARNNPSDGNDDFLIFHKMMQFIFPRKPRPPPNGHYEIMMESPLGRRLLPDEHMSCFDFLYYVTTGETYEYKFAWSPAWTKVATHLHFTDDLVKMVEGYLARAFGTSENNIPQFIAVHIRRGDFANQCWDTPGNCLAPLSTFEKRVEKIRRELRDKHNKRVKHVLVTSDEKDPEFWDEVQELGWVTINHEEERTFKKYGEWYLPIVEFVAQSMAVGFVGTHDSTFSLVSARRVEDWNNGPTSYVQHFEKE